MIRPDPHCRKCALFRKAQNVCVSARSSAGIVSPTKVRILFVGEAPGPSEDSACISFVGPAGQIFDRYVNKYFPDESWYLTNSVRCFPGRKVNGEFEKPKKEHLTACFPFLDEEVKRLKPDLIVPMGNFAISQTCNINMADAKITKLAGSIQKSKWDIPAVPIHHPAWVKRDEFANQPIWDFEWGKVRDVLYNKELKLPGEYRFLESDKDILNFFTGFSKRIQFNPGLEYAHDIETNSVNIFSDASKYRLAGFCFEPEKAVVVKLEEKRYQNLLGYLLQQNAVPIVHNASFDFTWHYFRLGVIPSSFFDTKALAFLLNELIAKDLKNLTSIFLPKLAGFKYESETQEEDITSIPDHILARRCAYDCMATYELKTIFWDSLDEERKNLYKKIVNPLLKTLVRMRVRGWKTDREKLKKLLDAALLKMDHLSEIAAQDPIVAAFLKESNKAINLASPTQKAGILFNLGITDSRKMDNNPDLISTAADVLDSHRGEHPFVGFCLDYAEIKDAATKYYKPFLDHSEYDEFLHPGYNWGGKTFSGEAKGTISARLSSANPNVMNPPESVRDVFTSRFEDGLLITADYSQIEPRIMASVSGDPILIEEYRSGGDIYNAIARETGLTRQYGADARQMAKVIFLAMSYGAGPEKLTKLGLTITQAVNLLDTTWNRFPVLQTWVKGIRMEALSKGKIKGLFGQWFHLPKVFEDDKNIVGHAMRQAGNLPIQNGGGYLTAWAMSRIDEEFIAAGISTDTLLPFSPGRTYKDASGVIAQLHDSITADVRMRDLKRAKAIMEDVMIRQGEELCKQWLKVPLKVKFTIGRTMAGGVLQND